MKKVNPRKRYNIYSLVTIGVILISFGYYYFFYIPQQEYIFHAKAFRIIEKIGSNVENQQINNITILKNYLIDYKQVTQNNGEKYTLPVHLKINEHTVKMKEAKKDSIRDLYLADLELIDDVVHVTLKSDILMGSVVGSFSIDSLFVQKLRHDFFKRFMVFDSTRVYLSEIPVGSYKITHDSLFGKGIFEFSHFIDIMIDNVVHKMYITPVNLEKGKTIYLGGIVDNDFFRRQTHGLNPNAVTIMLILLVIFLLSLPLLKLILISDRERLRTSDAFLGLISLILGAAFLSQVVLYGYTNVTTANKQHEKVIKSYANSIYNEFITELGTFVSQLNTIDKKLKISNNDAFKFYQYDKLYSQVDALEVHPNIRNTIWLNSSGDQLVKWGHKNPTPRANVSKRKYFTEIIHNRHWYFKDTTEKDHYYHKFYLEFIQSMTEGTVYPMLSKESTADSLNKFNFIPALNISIPSLDEFYTPEVICMGVVFDALTQVNMPENMSFMLINKEGDVLWHRDGAKSLQENLMEECNRHPALTSSLIGHSEQEFKAIYNSRKHYFYVKPIESLPLFLVVCLDNDYEKLTDIQVLSLSSEFYLIFMLLFLAELGIFTALFRKRYKQISGNRLMFEWIWPKPQNELLYRILTAYVLLVYLIYYAGGMNNNFFSHIFVMTIILTVNLTILKVSYLRLERVKIKDWNKKWVMGIFFLAFLFISILFFLVDISYKPWDLIGFSLILLLTFLMLNAVVRENINLGRIRKDNYRRSYNLYIFSIILAFGVFPSIDYFNRAYSIEKELYIRNVQFSMVDYNPSSFQNDTVDKKLESEYFKFCIDSNKSKKCQYDEHLVSHREAKLLKLIRYPLDTNYQNAGVTGMLNASDSSSFGWVYKNGHINLHFENSKVSISSPKMYPSYIKPSGSTIITDLLLFISLLLVLLLFFLLIRFWVSRIFMIYINRPDKLGAEEALENYRFVYIISSSLYEAKDFVNQSRNPDHVIDFFNFENWDSMKKMLEDLDKKTWNKGVLLIDPDPHEESKFDLKFRTILKIKEMMENKPKAQLIYISTTHPAFYTHVLKQKDSGINTYFKPYVNALGDFVRSYYPIRFSIDLAKGDIRLHRVFRMLEGKKISKAFSLDDLSNDTGKELAILKVQIESQNYFYSLWNNLEEREQYLVYDIAQNGLINYKSLPIIYNLMNKGILVINIRDNNLSLFNDSFQNFVLSIIDSEQAMQVEIMAKRTGNWNNLRFPLIMVLIASFALLFIAEQDVFNDVIGWLLAASASIPILLRTFMGFSSSGLFSSKSDQTEQK